MVKSKVRFDGLDVAAMVAHWNRVALGRRVINIYNGPNGDTYLFKLDKHSGEASNMLLLLESGIRFHSTIESYENPGMPSPFCAKLRKHLRGLRLESVQQLGQKDRVIMLTFGSGDAQRHTLILELYARGNILLTNSNYIILSLLRSHDYHDNDGANNISAGTVKVQVGHAYPVTYATTSTTTTSEGDGSSCSSTLLASTTNPLEWYQINRPPAASTEEQEEKEQANNNKGKGGKKKKGGSGTAAADVYNEWRSLLLQSPSSGVAHYSPSLIEHCLLCAEIDPKKLAPSSLDEEGWKRLQTTLQTEGERILANMDVVDTKGYIFYQPKPKQEEDTDDDEKKKDDAKKMKTVLSAYEDKLLLEFQPHILKQHEGMLQLEFDTFDRAVDAFFANIESQKRLLRAETQQAQAAQRLDKVKRNQDQRVELLLEQQELLKQQAQLVETHADMIDKAIQVVNSALDSGMDWDQLEDLVQMEQTQNQNPVALLIHRLELEHDAMVLRLDKIDYIEDEDHSKEPSKTMDVTIDLNETAFGNASTMFAKYRAMKEKGKKTIESSAKALQAAEESALKQLADAQKRKSHLTNALQTKRKPLWFEKFNWFITSDNYLVIAGRDAQQNEVIVKRYLRPGDAYLHADVHGAASCILRAKRRRTGGVDGGKTQTLPLSEQALREAGNFTICQSSAWSSRMVTSAWWVEPHQVSKTAPTGEYLTVGSFMIRGKKNYLPPSQLEMGLAVLFRLGDDEAIARHKNERRDFALMQMEAEDEEAPDLTTESQVSKISPNPKVDDAVTVQPVSTNEGGKSDINQGQKQGLSTITDRVPEEPDEPLDEENSDGNDDEESEDEGSAMGDSSNKDDGVSVTSSNKSKSKKGLSIRERKLIKKFGSLEAAQAAEEERLKSEPNNNAKSKGNNADANNGSAAPKRGKKTKMKRAAKKYADQDEEDRELALLALYAGEKDKKKEKKTGPEINETAKEAAAQTIAILKKDPSLVAEQLAVPVKEALAKCVMVQSDGSEDTPVVRWDKFDADVLEQLQSLELQEQQVAAAKRLAILKESTRIDNFSASLAGIIRTIRKYGHEGLETEVVKKPGQEARRKTKAEKENEKESWKQTLAEEGVVDEDLEDDAVDDTIELGKLTGKPHADDLILFAVPVCAPYQTLSQYTYRVKLTPGNQKRGKASKACIEIFLKDGQKTALSERSKELIKKVADTEWVHAISGDVKISAAGASKMKNKANKKKK